MKKFLLALFLLLPACGPNERPTGYKAGSGTGGSLVETCNEDDIINNWWAFETDNTIANTVAPSYRDYCTFIDENYVFLWNTVELYGYYNYGWSWHCSNENTLKITDTDSGNQYSMRIHGEIQRGEYEGCYDVKITEAGFTINGYVCPCEYNGN